MHAHFVSLMKLRLLAEDIPGFCCLSRCTVLKYVSTELFVTLLVGLGLSRFVFEFWHIFFCQSRYASFALHVAGYYVLFTLAQYSVLWETCHLISIKLFASVARTGANLSDSCKLAHEPRSKQAVSSRGQGA